MMHMRQDRLLSPTGAADLAEPCVFDLDLLSVLGLGRHLLRQRFDLLPLQPRFVREGLVERTFHDAENDSCGAELRVRVRTRMQPPHA